MLHVFSGVSVVKKRQFTCQLLLLPRVPIYRMWRNHHTGSDTYINPGLNIKQKHKSRSREIVSQSLQSISKTYIWSFAVINVMINSRAKNKHMYSDGRRQWNAEQRHGAHWLPRCGQRYINIGSGIQNSATARIDTQRCGQIWHYVRSGLALP